jgi:phage repressor protein C with HTH and peptisase S24 domain
MSLGDTIRRLRKGMPDGTGGRDGKGWTQGQLIKRVRELGGDLSQGQLSSIENGGVEIPRSILQLAEALGTDTRTLLSGSVPPPTLRHIGDIDTNVTKDPHTVETPLQFLRQSGGATRVRKRTLPVWASAEGGQGAWVVDDNPIAWIETPANLIDVTGGFAVRLVGNSAFPRYEHDDVLMINPTRMVKPGDWCLFLRETRDGEKHAAVKKLIRRTTKAWVVEQLNPPDRLELPREEWQKAFKIVGTQTDR